MAFMVASSSFKNTWGLVRLTLRKGYSGETIPIEMFLGQYSNKTG